MVIAAPNLSVLAINWSAKVTIVEPWVQLESVFLTSSRPGSDYVLWDTNSPLHEALQSSSKLKSLSVESGWLKNLSGLTEGFGSLTELVVPDRWLSEVCESKFENLRELRKLTVFFDHDTLDSESLEETPEPLKGLRALEFFPKLELLRLEDASDLAPCAVLALLSIQSRRPGLDIQITLDPLFRMMR